MCRVVLVGSVGAGVLGLVLVESVRGTYDDALAITAETAVVAGELGDPVSGLVSDVRELNAVAVDALLEAEALTANAAVSAEQVGTAARTNLADAVDGIATMSRRIADLVERIERFIPGDTESIAEDLDRIAGGLEPAADQLRSVGDTLVASSTNLEAAVVALRDARVVLAGVDEDLVATEASLAGVPDLAADLERRAREEQDQLDLTVWLLRLLVVLGTAAVAAGAGGAAMVLGDLVRADATDPASGADAPA